MTRSTGRSDLLKVRVRLRGETEKGWWFMHPKAGKDIFIPKSQAEYEHKDGQWGELELPEWLAIDRGLENEGV